MRKYARSSADDLSHTEFLQLVDILKPHLVEYIYALSKEDHRSPRHPRAWEREGYYWKTEREDRGLTREEVASRVGVSPEELALFEHGMYPADAMPVPHYLARLAKVLTEYARQAQDYPHYKKEQEEKT